MLTAHTLKGKQMFNKSQIMNREWKLARKANIAKFGLRLRRAMRTAWNKAKYAVAAAKRAAMAALPRTRADDIRETIVVLECKDRWTQADHARYSELMQDLRAA
jgi:hypothetical protein